MVREAWLLGAWIAVAAVWAVLHVMLLIRTARAPRLAVWMRVLAWLPPLTPVVGWRAGARGVAALWTLSGAGYLVLRSAA